MLLSYLKKNYNINFILASHLSQDCQENLFSDNSNRASRIQATGNADKILLNLQVAYEKMVTETYESA